MRCHLPNVREARRPSRRVVLAVLSTLYCTLIAGPVLAASTISLSLPDLARRSSAIVHGTVVSTSSRWNEDHSLIVTEVRVRVEETFRGRAEPELTVIEPGGRVGKLRVDVDGAATFTVGEELVLFLARGKSGLLTPVGMSQGKFNVAADSNSGRKRVFETTSASRSQPRSLDSFLDDLRRTVRTLPKEKED